MIIDTTVSSFQKRFKFHILLAKVKHCFKSTCKRYKFPGGMYDSKQEHNEFRQLYIREFLERNGRDSDIDLKCIIVVWKDEEIIEVITPLANNSQNGLELLELWQN